MNKVMGRGGASALALVGMAMGASSPAEAAPKLGFEFGYFLPRTSFGAAAAERLIKCPAADDRDAVIETTVVIDSATKPDPDAYVRLDTSSGPLAKRTTEIKLNSNGTLVSFNGSTEGEGGAVLGAVIKVATTVAASMVGGGMLAAPMKMMGDSSRSPQRRLSFSCTDKTEQKVAERDRLADAVANLEAQVIAGHDSPAVAALLDARRAALADADDALTITSKAVVDPKSGEDSGMIRIEPFDPDGWFKGDVPARIRRRPGINGFLLSWTADKRIAAAFTRSAWQAGIPADPQSYLLYRRPIPVSVKAVSCEVGGSDCRPDASDDAITATKVVSVAQFSPIFVVRLGRGGIFGSRQAEADFDANGTPTRLKYGSASGGADIASVIDAGGDGFSTLRGAGAAARDRQLQVLRDKKEYRELTTALNDPSAQ
jgi:hypothetical protein